MQIAALAIVAALVLAFRAVQFALLTREVQWGYDFSFYWTAGRRLLDGQAIYSAAQLAGPYAPQGQDGFLYPPPFAALVTPSLEGSYGEGEIRLAAAVATALAAWRTANLGLAIAVGMLTFWLLRIPF